MKINQISRRIKRGFTLIELTVVILTTSILLVGFTAFTLFFTNQYSYEMEINDTENSAITLKYAIGNNIDKFNYTYEKNLDFNDLSYDNGGLDVFSTVTPIETENSDGSGGYNYYKGVTIRQYRFVKQTAEYSSYFGYLEYNYTFNTVQSLKTSEREYKLRDKIDDAILEGGQPEEFIIYETRSRMVLTYSLVKEVSTNCNEYQFTIDYDFESESLDVAGTRKIVFNKYVYFIN